MEIYIKYSYLPVITIEEKQDHPILVFYKKLLEIFLFYFFCDKENSKKILGGNKNEWNRKMV